MGGSSAGGYPGIGGSSSVPKAYGYPGMSSSQPSSSSGYPGMPGMTSMPSMPNQFQTSSSAYGQYSVSQPSGYSLPPQSQAPQLPQMSMGDPYSSNFSSMMGSQQFQAANSLKRVVCPINAVREFLRLAHPNTSTKIETCAILAGKLVGSKYIITSLIVPR